ncbi:MAG: LacI family transcriptional regulator [Clostridiales bacterium]|nr:LacI family transcriptional regulator [Clostridiales bacterium]
MKKQVTIKDIAREAGVSVATVSYVINDRTDMRISEQTRKKVLQIINLFGYTPNQSAQSLATARSRFIALALTPGISPLHDAEQMYFTDVFSSFLQEHNYNIIYMNSSCRQRFDRADAIVCYDLSEADFLEMGDENFVPLLAIDCMIEDPFPIFFKVNTDYPKLYEYAQSQLGTEFTLCTLTTANLKKKKMLESIFPDIAYISGYKDLMPFLHEAEAAKQAPDKATSAKPLLVIHHTLATMLDGYPGLLYVPQTGRAKFDILMNAMELAIGREQVDSHDLLAPLQTEA